jgi:zinc transporter, ZIP family
MTTSDIALLGAIAGFTIFLGLPIARMRTDQRRAKTFLNGLSAGILLFLVLDIFSHAGEEVEHVLEGAADGETSWLRFAVLGAVYVSGFALGLLSLVYVARLGRSRGPKVSIGPGAMAVAEFTIARQEALRLGMAIAVAIGLHNFSEGLAIGQAASAGELSLALLLVIGFALHNATEGFGIVGPLAAAEARASWPWLLLAGLVGGGPTFVGTLVGTHFTSQFVFVGFLALAGGAIVYVIGELFAVGRRLSWETTLWGVAGGFLLGFVTELVLEVAGG